MDICQCHSTNSSSIDSCGTSASCLTDNYNKSDVAYANAGHTVSSDVISTSGDSRNTADGVDNAFLEYAAVSDSICQTSDNEDSSKNTVVTVLKDDTMSVQCLNGLATSLQSAGYRHEICEGVDGEFESCIGNFVTDDGSGNIVTNFSDSNGSEVGAEFDTAMVVCDYDSVCDDASIHLDEVVNLTCVEDNNGPLRNGLISGAQISSVDSFLDDLSSFSENVDYFNESEKNVNTIIGSALENIDNSNEACNHFNSAMASSLAKCDSSIEDEKAKANMFTSLEPGGPIEGSDAILGDENHYAATDVSTFTDHETRPTADHKPEVSLRSFYLSTDIPADFHHITCILPPQCSPLPMLTHPELPPLPFPPIFYICRDEKTPLELEETCVIDMNILQKTELSNAIPTHFAERCDSQLSTLSEKQDICRICHCESDPTNNLKYIHLSCLQKWIKSSDKKSCELCNFDYIMTMKTRPFKQWEKLDMTLAERRKIVCSVTFHVIAITCVIWSLYVLIDRTTEEVNSGTLDWPFWTKLIVVAIGFTGGLVFMYVQCKMYLQLCLRWRQFNKLIYIENAPEDAQVRAEAAARIKARSGEAGGIVNTVALQEVDSF